MNVGKIKIAVDLAIADGEAMGHFVLPVTQVKNIKPASNQLRITIEDGQ